MEEKLIELVSRKKFLYDKKHNLYRKSSIKEDTWKEIAEQLGLCVTKVKSKWICFRDMYTRELRKKNKLIASGSSKKRLTKFKHFKRLNFLKDVYKPRKSKTKLNFLDEKSINIFSDGSFDEPLTLESKIDSSESMHFERVSTSTPYQRIKSTSSDAFTVEKPTHASDETFKLISDMRREEYEKDDISAFAENIKNLIRQAEFTIVERIDLQIKILNLVQKTINKKCLR